MTKRSDKETLIPKSPTAEDYARAHAEHTGDLEGHDPIGLFEIWLADAKKKELNDPNAMALATVDESGMPDVRMVLLKDIEAGGFVFYTNLSSQKGRQLAQNPKASLLFHWKSLRRQVRIRGEVVRVSDAEADAYFATRARQSQIGAWASPQSQPLEGRLALEKRVAEQALRFGISPIPRPDHWSGFRLVPISLEFWRDMPFRLHDRHLFERQNAAEGWSVQKLFP